MEGTVPIGYKIEERKLIPDKENLPILETIFEKYVELESVFKLKNYLEQNNIKSRTGRNFSKGNLYKILSNKTYIGMVKHKDTYYNGEHEGIIDENIFNEVQKILDTNRNNNKCKHTAKSPSLLAGKIFDDNGNRMNPSHSNTKGKRYRYYVSQAIIQGSKSKAGTLTKIPAGEIENLVRKEITALLADKDKIQEYISGFDVYNQKMILSKASEIEIKNDFIRAILAKVVLFKDKIEIIICKSQLVKGLESFITGVPLLDEVKNEPEEAIVISRNVRISTTSRKGNVLVTNNFENKEVNINPFLIKIITQSYYWNKLIEEGKAQSSVDIQKMENHNNNSYVKEILRLKFLAPDIVEAILNGTQPRDLTADKLRKIKTIDWQEQRKILNF